MQERLSALGLEVEPRELDDSTRTAAEAAAAVGCDVAQIVKSLVFVDGAGEPIVCLCAGDRRVDTAKLGEGVRQANADEVRSATGFAIGGVPPLGHDRPLRTVIDCVAAPLRRRLVRRRNSAVGLPGRDRAAARGRARSGDRRRGRWMTGRLLLPWPRSSPREAHKLVFDAPWAAAAFTATVIGRRVLERGTGRLRGQRVFDRAADRGTSLQILVGGLLALVAGIGLAFLPFAAIPGGGAIVVAGLGIAWLGSALRLWARLSLDRFFQPVVLVQADHEVVDTGPYRLIRHPAYTGSLLGMLGIGLALGSWLSVAVLVLVPLGGYLRRIGVEEAALTGALGERYAAYARRTRKLLPGI